MKMMKFWKILRILSKMMKCKLTMRLIQTTQRTRKSSQKVDNYNTQQNLLIEQPLYLSIYSTFSEGNARQLYMSPTEVFEHIRKLFEMEEKLLRLAWGSIRLGNSTAPATTFLSLSLCFHPE